MECIKTYDIEEVVAILPDELPNFKMIRKISGIEVNLSKQRYVNFVKRGTTCEHCGMKGEFFALERQEGEQRGVLNLYGLNWMNEEVIISSVTDKRVGRAPIGTILCTNCQHKLVSHSKSRYDGKA